MTKVQHRLKDKEDLQALLKELGIFDQEYLFQTYIPLLKVNNRALDVRVVMQKYNNRKWQCTGIECRVAREDEDLTNIARGGEAMTLEKVIKKFNPRAKLFACLPEHFKPLPKVLPDHGPKK